MNTDHLVVSSLDYDRLGLLIRDCVASGAVPRDRLCALQAKFDRAQVLQPREMPPDVITMNSTVRLHDVMDDEVETFTLAYPAFADITKNMLSILAPMGTAMFGRREGDVFGVDTPFGGRRVKVEQIEFQPESRGLYDL